MQLIGDFYDSSGDLPNLLSGSHADFIFISFPSSILPEGNEIEARKRIETIIDTDLKEHSAGRSIGSAFGVDKNYLDFILFDGHQSIEIIINAMKTANLPQGSEIHYWAAEITESYTL